MLLLPRLPWGLLSSDLLRAVERDVRKTLIWLCAAIIVCAILSGILGYAAGFQTAQPTYDMLAVVGAIAIGIIVIGVVVLVGIGWVANLNAGTE